MGGVFEFAMPMRRRKNTELAVSRPPFLEPLGDKREQFYEQRLFLGLPWYHVREAFWKVNEPLPQKFLLLLLLRSGRGNPPGAAALGVHPSYTIAGCCCGGSCISRC